MKRPNRTLEVFSLSALDLFASALGAFIIIGLILFPYYQKKAKVETTLQQIEQELELARIDADNAQRRATEAMQRFASVRADPAKLKEETVRLKNAEAAAANLKHQLAALNKQTQRRVPFALLGLPSKSNSFVLLVDMSGTMAQYTDIMMKTLSKIISPLDDATRLGIIGFGSITGRLVFWPGENRTLGMSTANKAAALRYIRGIPSLFGGGTPTLDALEASLSYKVDSVILLSDGAPNTPPDDIVETITRKNKGNKEIHTVGIGNYVEDTTLVKFLNKLAQKNKGYFVGAAR